METSTNAKDRIVILDRKDRKRKEETREPVKYTDWFVEEVKKITTSSPTI